MNARQKCKKLKQRNKLLMNVITADPEFLRVFNYWTNTSFNVSTPQVQFQTYAARCPLEPMFGDDARRFAENSIVRELSQVIKENIEWKVENSDPYHMKLEGRVMIAKKEEG